MSGHSHYATIHRQKEANDAARGSVFSKLARGITLAVKSGGPSPDSNLTLRMLMDKAHAANMPKENIQRAIEKATGGESLEEVTYEGFGPSGIAVIVSVATDNRNRAAQEVKNIFERAGGRLAGPGAVSFNFVSKGMIVVKKGGNPEEQILQLIDLGAEDVEETDDGIEVYVSPDKVGEIRSKVESGGFEIIETEIFLKPTNVTTVSDPKEASKALSFLETLNNLEDVQKVYSNLEV